MPLVEANGLQIEVEQHGDPSNPSVLLVMGLAAQLVHWPADFIKPLVSAGYHVVTFDNRDIGLSEKLESEHAPPPHLAIMSGMVHLGWLLAPYNLSDMADDSVGVLDALGIDRAHLIGVSMGGMIGQIFAAKHSERLHSLTTIMSSTNRRSLPKADAEIVREIVATRSAGLSREEVIERTIALWDMLGTKEGGRDMTEFREIVTSSFDRCSYPAGVRRQIAAIVASGDLRKWSRQVRSPTLVIHGKADRLTPYQGGEDIAATIPGARLDVIDNMGHDLPPKFMPRIVRGILEHLQAAAGRGDSTRAA